MKGLAIFCLALMPVSAQEVAWLGAYSGRVIRDAQRNWLIVETVEQSAGNRDLRIQKLTPDLKTTLWDRVVGGSGSEEAAGLLSDPEGAVFILGNTTSKDLPVTKGALGATPPSGPTSAFLIKLDSAGNPGFSTYLHDGTSTHAESLLKIADDTVVLALSGRLWQVDAQGTRVKAETVSRWIGGPMALDDYGKLWVAGTTWSDDLPVTAGAFQARRQSGVCYSIVGPSNCPTGFIMRLDAASGAIEAASYLGGTVPAFMTAIAVAPDGSPIVTGNVRGGSNDSDFPTTPGSFQPKVRTRGLSPWFTGRPLAPSTPFVARLSRDLDQLVYGTYLAGSRAERATWLSVDRLGRAIITGDTVSWDFPGTGAFAKPCGPDPGGPTPIISGFVARLSPDGAILDASAILFSSPAGFPFGDRDNGLIVPTTRGLLDVALDQVDKPVIACIVNGANFRAEDAVAPQQLLTLIGAGIPSNARLLFDGVPAELLYIAPDQINAAVPPEVRGRESTEVALEADGVYSRVRVFEVRPSNPTIKVFVRPDGTLENRGNPLADVRLESGAQNGTEHPARWGEMVEIYATGLDLSSPVEVFMPDLQVSPTEALLVEGTAGGLQKVRTRVPAGVNSGVVPIAIQNSGRRTVDNAGFIWVE